MHRVITACFGAATVWLLYVAGRRLSMNPTVGLLAALMLTVSPTAVWHSRFMTPNAFVTFFSVAALLASALVYQRGARLDYALAGMCVGLTASSKYNGALVVMSFLAAHVARHRAPAATEHKLHLGLLTAGVAFFLTTPFALFDAESFLRDLTYEARHYATGHEGMEGRAVSWYLAFAWRTAGGLYLMAVLGFACVAVSHPREAAILGAFPLAYFASVSTLMVRNDQTFLPLIPFLCLWASWGLVCLFARLKVGRPVSLQRSTAAVTGCLTAFLLVTPLSNTIEDLRRLTIVNSRETARAWIMDNLPAGTRIAVESYSPFVDPSRFSVVGVRRIIDHQPEWYVENGFEYVVASQGMYGRFYENPDRYRDQTSRYDRLFAMFRLNKRFTDGGFQVRLYQVEPR